MIPAHVTLNVHDIYELARHALAAKGIEMTGLTVMSWNYTLLVIDEGTLTEPVRHHLLADHGQLNKKI